MLRVVLDCGDNCPSDDVCGDTVSGDTNGDGITNILDVVGLVNFILGGQLDECGLVAADFNQDGVVNILVRARFCNYRYAIVVMQAGIGSQAAATIGSHN